MLKSLLTMAFSASTLIAKTCFVVLLPGWYAAWFLGILSDNLFYILLIRHIVNVFRSTDRSTIGRRFTGGPFFLPGFCSGQSIQSSFG